MRRPLGPRRYKQQGYRRMYVICSGREGAAANRSCRGVFRSVARARASQVVCTARGVLYRVRRFDVAGALLRGGVAVVEGHAVDGAPVDVLVDRLLDVDLDLGRRSVSAIRGNGSRARAYADGAQRVHVVPRLFKGVSMRAAQEKEAAHEGEAARAAAREEHGQRVVALRFV